MIIREAQKNNSNKDSSDDNNNNDNGNGNAEHTENVDNKPENSGTMIVDATCAPQNIKYPQNIELLNEAREKLEKIIDKASNENGFYKPRMYRKNARKDYLQLAKCKKRTVPKYVKP